MLKVARNDVGNVSEFGSVRVPEFMTVHQYSHVHHIVSRVIGRLRNECDCYDALRVSGVPKVGATERTHESLDNGEIIGVTLPILLKEFNFTPNRYSLRMEKCS